MKDSWFDPAFASEWDGVDSRQHPTRAEQLDVLAAVAAEAYQPGTLALDLGCGSGQVEELILRKRPDMRIVGVDSSPAMLAIARSRLAKLSDRFTIIERDLVSLETAQLPVGRYSVVFSVQVLHELDTAKRQSLFDKVAALLESGAVFLIMDRLRADLDGFQVPYSAAWRRLERFTALASAADFEGYKRRIREKEDEPASLDEFRNLLEAAGFRFVLLHLNFDRAVMAGVKA